MGRLSMNVVKLFFTLVFACLVPLNKTCSSFVNKLQNVGNETDIQSFPHQASLVMDPEDVLPYCGAVIIDKYYVLTDRSCVQNMNIRNYRILVGSNCNYKGGMLHEIQNFTDQNVIDVSIAIIRVKEPFDFDQPGIAPISIAKNYLEDKSEKESRMGILAGWNTYPVDCINIDRESCTIRENEVTLLSNKECKARYKYSYIAENTICAGTNVLENENYDFDACVGDLGGALISADKRELIAISNRKFGCEHRNRPSLFTDVSYYVPWIMETIEGFRG